MSLGDVPKTIGLDPEKEYQRGVENGKKKEMLWFKEWAIPVIVSAFSVIVFYFTMHYSLLAKVEANCERQQAQEKYLTREIDQIQAKLINIEQLLREKK